MSSHKFAIPLASLAFLQYALFMSKYLSNENVKLMELTSLYNQFNTLEISATNLVTDQ